MLFLLFFALKTPAHLPDLTQMALPLPSPSRLLRTTLGTSSFAPTILFIKAPCGIQHSTPICVSLQQTEFLEARTYLILFFTTVRARNIRGLISAFVVFVVEFEMNELMQRLSYVSALESPGDPVKIQIPI